MSFWSDFAEGFVPAFNRQYEQEDQQKHETELFEKRQASDIASQLGKLRTRKETRDNSGAKLAVAQQQLLKWGADPEAVNNIIATGDLEGVTSLVTDLGGVMSTLKEKNKPIPKDLVGATINSAVLSASTTEGISFKDIPDSVRDILIEQGLTEEDFEYTVPGAIGYETPVVRQQPDLKELSDVEKRVLDNAINQANVELNTVREVQSYLNDQLLNNVEGQSQAERDQLQEDKELLLNRSSQILSAIEASGGDNPVYTDVFQLYGSQYFNEILDSYPEFEGAPFSPSIRENLDKDVVKFNSVKQAERLLYDYKAFPVGTGFTIEGLDDTFFYDQ